MTAARQRPHFGVTVPQIKRPWVAAADASRSFEIDKHITLGCTMFIIEFFGRDTREPAQLFAEEVMPNFR